MRWVVFVVLVLMGPFAGMFGILATLLIVLKPLRGHFPGVFEIFWTAIFACWWASLIWAYRRQMTFRRALVFGERSSDATADVILYKRLALAACLLSFSLGALIALLISQSHFMLD